MKMFKKIIKQPWTRYLITALLGLLIGWFIFKDSETAHEGHEHTAAEGENAVWTCSMHPQIRQSEPGDCPICGMDLIPLSSMEGAQESESHAALEMTPEAVALANISVTPVQRAEAENHLTLTGKIEVDEQRIATIASTVPGRVEKLYISFTGQQVQRGSRLATIYSPDLMTAQRELLEAAAYKSANPELYEAAREKLRLWKINERQIEKIEESGVVQTEFDVYADKSGYVVNRLVSEGQYVARGSALFEVVDYGALWVMLDAYESDLAWIQTGDEIVFTAAALPGEEFTAKVDYIDPAVDPVTRAVSVRAETLNRDGRLKPEMFVNATVMSRLSAPGESLVIPRTAVLWTGKRSVAYVKRPGEKAVFEMREITLGPRMGEWYVVEDGLNEGEQVVTNGVFSVDAAAQLRGKPSMMSPDGIRPTAAHDHAAGSPAEVATPDFNDVNAQFKEQLKTVFNAYIQLKQSLVDSDEKQAATAAAQAASALQGVDMNLLDGGAHDYWMDRLGGLQSAVGEVQAADDIAAQREAFSHMTTALYESLKAFEVKSLDAYYQFCPMAFDNQGAYWLSKTEEIRNPYFGESMLTCGSTEEVLD